MCKSKENSAEFDVSPPVFLGDLLPIQNVPSASDDKVIQYKNFNLEF